MRVLWHEYDMATHDLLVMTDQSRYPVRVHRCDVEDRPDLQVEGLIRREIDWRKANRTFRDNRHDTWKGARQPWVSA